MIRGIFYADTRQIEIDVTPWFEQADEKSLRYLQDNDFQEREEPGEGDPGSEACYVGSMTDSIACWMFEHGLIKGLKKFFEVDRIFEPAEVMLKSHVVFSIVANDFRTWLIAKTAVNDLLGQ